MTEADISLYICWLCILLIELQRQRVPVYKANISLLWKNKGLVEPSQVYSVDCIWKCEETNFQDYIFA